MKFVIALTLVAMVPQEVAYTLTSAMKQAISKAVGNKLLDGESARYRWPQHTAQYGSYCGWVNAKNSYGAYVGFRPFYVIGGKTTSGKFFVSSVSVSTDDPKDTDTKIVETMCRSAKYDLSGPPSE